MRRVSISILAIGLLLVLAASAFGEEAIKIGYIDMQRALNTCDVGKEAKKQISQEMEKMQKNISGRQKELDKLKEDLEKRGSVMSESVRLEKEREYQGKQVELKRLQREFEEDLRRKDRELTDKILKNFDGILKKVAEEKKYTLILEKSQAGILYISSDLDLTVEIIKSINQLGTIYHFIF